jgi:iron complex transport system substrate-binding protein
MRVVLITLALLAVACRVQKFERGASVSTNGRQPFRGAPATNLSSGCVSEFRPGVDYFPDKTQPKYARIFDVSYRGNYKIVKLAVERAVASEAKVTDTMVLVQCGTPPPELTGDLAHAAVITIPAMTIASNDNCDIAAISELGYEDRLTAVGGGHLYNQHVREKWQRKELATIGYAWHGLPNAEVLLARPPDVLFMRRATLEQGRSLERARELGIRAAPTLARMEGHYLGYAEWVKYFALFLNAERKANELFFSVAEKSERLARGARSAAIKPIVFWAGVSSGGTWSVAQSSLDLRTRYLMDAGVQNPFFDERSLPAGQVPNEKLLGLAAEAEYWISDSHTSKGWPEKQFLNHFRAYRENRIYHHEKRSIFELDAYDWYELGAMRPDLVLEDLVSLFHPDLVPDHELMFFDSMKKEKSN